MKLSVRSKVANGLVICLLVPRVASTAVEMFESADEGLKSFSASDEFILGAENGVLPNMVFQGKPSGDPSNRGGNGNGPPPHPSDPSGHGPPPHAGGDPSASLDPADCVGGDNDRQILYVQRPAGISEDADGNEIKDTLFTAECDPSGVGVDPSGSWDPSGCSQLGASDFFEVSLFPAPAPGTSLTYTFESSDESEARLVSDSVIFDEYSCFPQAIWVEGQDDGEVDGDVEYIIEIFDENNNLAVDQDNNPAVVKGINLDDDNYAGVSIDSEVKYHSETDEYVFYLDALIVENQPLFFPNDLIIKLTPKLAITDYNLDQFKGEIMMKPHELVLGGVNRADLPLELEVRFVSKGNGPQGQKIFAGFINPENGLMTSTESSIPLPKAER